MTWHAVVVRAHVDEGLLDVHAHAEMPWVAPRCVTPAATTATTGTAAVMVVRVSGSARRRMPS